MADLTNLVLTTKLDAVNIMLFTIGEQPVSSLDESGLTDVAIAKAVLAEVNRDVQSEGWKYNTDYNYALAQDTSGRVAIPTNALSIEPAASSQYVERSGYMWDTLNHTNVINTALYCDIIRYLDYEAIPEAARYYIAVRAARIYQKRMLGDDSIEVFTEKQESTARARMEGNLADAANANFLNDPGIAQMTGGGRATGWGSSGLGNPRVI